MRADFDPVGPQTRSQDIIHASDVRVQKSIVL